MLAELHGKTLVATKLSGNLYESILKSAQFWLDRKHILNTHYTISVFDKVYLDILTYSKFVHGISNSKDIVLEDRLQILANFYNIVIIVKKKEIFHSVVPYSAREEHFRDFIVIAENSDDSFDALVYTL